MNWINSWKAGNKKEKYGVSLRLGTITILELKYCPCSICEKTKCSKFRFMILNFGLEI